MTHRKQLSVYLALLVVNAFAAFASYAFFGEQLISSTTALAPSIPAKTLDQPMWYYGLANAILVLVAYGVLGLIGYFASRKAGLPGIYSPGCGWRRWVVIPMLLAIPCAVLLVAGDLLFAPINGLGRLPHPAFPISIFASVSAGIGEEIEFRVFLFGLWSLILTWLFKRFNGRTAALWIANVIAALGFAAGHFFSLAMISGAVALDATGQMTFLFDKINPMLIVEAVLLNGVIGLLAGWRYMKDGLVAATGVHLWTDIFWHVLWGLVPG
jgi:hypothetical protein